MELRHLRYFVAVAEELHFTRAAARLHMTQPPLSQQISQLEHQLGVKLFVRSTSGVQLTDTGRVFLERARQVLETVEDLAASAQRADRGEVGRLVIGFSGSAAIDVVAGAVGAYRERYPAVHVALLELATSAQIEGLLDGRLHVGFLRERAVDDRLEIEIMRREPLVAVLPASHRLASSRQVSVKHLVNEKFVLAPRRQSSSYTDVVIGTCAAAGFTPCVVQEVSETLTLLGVVAAGIGVSLMPVSVTRVETKGVVYRPLRPQSATTQLAAVWRRGLASPVVDRFLETCRSTIAV